MFKRTEVALFFVQREELWFGLYEEVCQSCSGHR